MNQSLVFASLAALAAASLGTSAQATLFLNEVNLDPPGGNDNGHEFIEIRGTPNTTISNHYLVVVENELSGTANAGLIEFMVDLNNQTIGSNGYLTLNQSNILDAKFTFSPNATNLVATSASFFTQWDGLPGLAAGSNNDRLENSGGTYFIVKTTPSTPGYVAPTTGFDIDTTNNGTITWPSAGYEVVDSIGIISDLDEATAGAVYGEINFGPTALGPGYTPITTGDYVNAGFEVEYFARLGDSEGSTIDDWHVANLTDDPRRPGTDFTAISPYAVISAFDTVAGQQTGPLETTRPDLFTYAQSVITHGLTNPGGVPIPEPATLGLVLVGAAGIFGRRRR